MRPRSPAARNAFKNQISSLVKLSVMDDPTGTGKTIAAQDMCFLFSNMNFRVLNMKTHVFATS
jgi:hypothetical protein